MNGPFQWGAAIDRENAGFIKHSCFEPVTLPKNAKVLPGIWVFIHNRDHSAKVQICLGGHRQLLGRDYFANKNYCAVLSSRDNHIILALGANEGWSVHQTDVVQAFLYGIMDDADIYIQPPAQFPST